MSWFWLNIPLALVFFGAWCGIPLYMVLKHPSWSHHPADSIAVEVEVETPTAGGMVVAVAESITMAAVTE